MEQEIFVFGQIITEPLLIWSDPKVINGEIQVVCGFNCEVQTNSNLIDGTPVVYYCQIQYDIRKWKDRLVRNGELVKLSKKDEKNSYIHPSGKLHICNIVQR